VIQTLMAHDDQGMNHASAGHRAQCFRRNAGRAERGERRQTCRNGYRDRELMTPMAALNLRVPKLRQGSCGDCFVLICRPAERLAQRGGSVCLNSCGAFLSGFPPRLGCRRFGRLRVKAGLIGGDPVKGRAGPPAVGHSPHFRRAPIIKFMPPRSISGRGAPCRCPVARQWVVFKP
jgi:hypothetical protein